MSKLISFAGVSRVNGVLKFRGAQSVARIDQLRKLGDTDVEMSFLNTEMTKSQAAKRLIATNFANGRADVLALLVKVANDDNPFKAKKARVVKVKVPNNAMVRLVGAKVEVEELTTAEARKIRAEWNRKHAHLSYDGE
jgi:hypothetical protein